MEQGEESSLQGAVKPLSLPVGPVMLHWQHLAPRAVKGINLTNLKRKIRLK